MESTVSLGLGLAGVALALWPIVRSRRASARSGRDVPACDEKPIKRNTAGGASSEASNAERDLTPFTHEREAKLKGPAARSESFPPRSPERRSVPVAPPVQPTAPPTQAITDPFLARMGEQAREDRLRQQASSRKLRHKPIRPVRPPVTSMPSAYREGARRIGEKDYGITYVTEWGEVTERRITVRRTYERDGFVYVEAFCSLRGEERTFRADRMRAVVHLATGERVFTPEANFSH